jgi:hypothetical protein
MNNSILAALVYGTIAFASPGFAQTSAANSDVAQERVIITRQVAITPRVEPAGRIAIAPTEPATLNGGVGGSIGGYYINGATRADNLPITGVPLR